MHSLGKYKEAISFYDDALVVDRKCAIALAYKGLSLGELDEVEEALTYFKKALEIDREYDLAQLSKKMAQNILKSKMKELGKSKIQ